MRSTSVAHSLVDEEEERLFAKSYGCAVADNALKKIFIHMKVKDLQAIY